MADELDPDATHHHVDEGDRFDEVRPSSVGKNTLADRGIPLAFSSSAICFLNRLIFTCASQVMPGFRSVSISARFFHNRDVSGLPSSRLATSLAAVKSDR